MAQEMIKKDIYYIGNFSETVEEKGRYFKVGEMFSAGTHRGVTYTEEDIKQLASEFKAEEGIPVQLDHSESAKDTVGWIREVYAEGKKLMGKLEILDKEAQKKVDNGLLKKLSVSFYLKQMGDKLRPFKIREVSLVAFPQVKGAQLFNEQPMSLTEKFKALEEKINKFASKKGIDVSSYNEKQTKEKTKWSDPYKELEEIKQAQKDEVYNSYLERIEREAKLSRMLPKERLEFLQKEQLDSYLESENERIAIIDKLADDSLDERMSSAEAYAQKAMAEMEADEAKRKKFQEDVWKEKRKK
ncbi:DUF2213 domain-containing protein [Bacillus gobiensis]|uniref:hypothetical protein n=1 Tax=Bacillus gobiensis TaxID=1441095 RepID=UPI003D1906FC